MNIYEMTIKDLYRLFGEHIKTDEIKIQTNGDQAIAWTRGGNRIKPINGSELVIDILNIARDLDLSKV